MKKANEAIKAHTASDEWEIFVDIEGSMLGSNGKPRRELLQKDGLHMTDGGYQRWTGLLKPHLKALLAQGKEPAQAEKTAPIPTE